jgi:hypothetical protein
MGASSNRGRYGHGCKGKAVKAGGGAEKAAATGGHTSGERNENMNGSCCVVLWGGRAAKGVPGRLPPWPPPEAARHGSSRWAGAGWAAPCQAGSQQHSAGHCPGAGLGRRAGLAGATTARSQGRWSPRAGPLGQYAPRRSWYRRMESRTNSRILICGEDGCSWGKRS